MAAVLGAGGLWLYGLLRANLLDNTTGRTEPAARRTAAQVDTGTLPAVLPDPGGADELARLARTVNATLDRLELADERQRRFTADASHELRNPLSAVRARLEVALARPDQESVRAALADTERLQHVAADLLLLARLDGRPPLAAEPVDLALLAAEDLARRPAPRVPVRVVAGAPVPAYGNPGQLARLLANLVDNALRHARTEVRVHAAAGPGGDPVLEVADDGPGIPAADRERVFERFVRLDGARSRDRGGTGLGLAIAREIALAHGGALTSGTAPGGGARLTLRLPAQRPAWEREGREAGRKAEIETVRNFLGVPVDHFAELNLAGFHHLAGALDGVPVCLKHDVKDRYSGADFTAGHHTLDGRQSLAFVRQRHGLPMGDLDRTRRQQAFLAGARYELSQAGTFTDPAKLVRLLDTARQDLVTDEGWDLLSFVGQAKNLSGGDVEFVTLPIKGFARNHGEDVNVVDDMKIKRLIAEQIGPKAAAGPDSSGAPGAPAHSPAPASSPAPSTRDGGGSASSAIDGGGIPCVD
ncbi:LCP family protein [Streptomyces sp. NPDC086023]|uniref:LCP family glycopolymer transferase n=1 Tax=Streptomyces sp. NPDC086023 TaxID=3365746 RepID=UPI0037D4C52E